MQAYMGTTRYAKRPILARQNGYRAQLYQCMLDHLFHGHSVYTILLSRFAGDDELVMSDDWRCLLVCRVLLAYFWKERL